MLDHNACVGYYTLKNDSPGGCQCVLLMSEGSGVTVPEDAMLYIYSGRE